MAAKNIVTPDFGGSASVTVVEILVKPGETITADTPIMTLESDKATMEIPAGEAGTVKTIKVKTGDQVATGEVLLILDTEQAQTTKADKKEKPDKAQAKAPAPAPAKPTPAAASAAKDQDVEEEAEADEDDNDNVLTGTLQTDSDVHAGPGVRRLAHEFGVNLKQITGSGPKQRILKEDLQGYVKSQLNQAQTGGGTLPVATMPAIDFSQFGHIETQPLSRIKKISGKFLHRNWMMIPHITQFAEADITTMEEFRQSRKGESVKLTPLVFVMKAVVASLKAFPQFNASLDANGENLIVKNYYHIGVAVDTADGLVVPVIKNVDQKGLVDLAKELAIISEKARNKQLLPADMQGGSFSISSLGGIGGTAFTPIINAPEVAILGVSKSSMKPVYQDKQFVPRLMLPLSLSYDHRVIDGADGARFIMHLSQMLSDIRNLLM